MGSRAFGSVTPEGRWHARIVVLRPGTVHALPSGDREVWIIRHRQVDVSEADQVRVRAVGQWEYRDFEP